MTQEVSYKMHYERMRNRLPDWDAADRNPALFACRRPWLPKDRGARILDLGSGWGNQLLALHAAGYRNIEGVEQDAGMVEIAKRSAAGRIQFHLGEGKEFLANKAESYDLIIVNDVIEHVPVSHASPMIRGIYAALTPGGTVVLRTPNMASVLSAYSRYLDVTHVTGYTEFSIQQILDEGGFIDHQFVQDDWGWRPSTWRPWAPWRGLGVRGAVNHSLHKALYWLRAMQPQPTRFGCNIEVYSRKG